MVKSILLSEVRAFPARRNNNGSRSERQRAIRQWNLRWAEVMNSQWDPRQVTTVHHGARIPPVLSSGCSLRAFPTPSSCTQSQCTIISIYTCPEHSSSHRQMMNSITQIAIQVQAHIQPLIPFPLSSVLHYLMPKAGRTHSAPPAVYAAMGAPPRTPVCRVGRGGDVIDELGGVGDGLGGVGDGHGDVGLVGSVGRL